LDQQYGEFVGVDNLYYALVTADSASAYTAGTPEYLAPVGEIAGAPTINKKNTYYDNKPQNTFITEGETEVKVVVPNVPASKAAALLGKYYDATSGRVYDTGKPNPPDIALGFRFNMGNDDYRYFWYLKGKFSGGSEEAKSKEDDVDVKTYELTYTAVTTTYQWTVDSESQSLKRVFGDTADDAFSATNWFSQVQTPSTASVPDAIALSTIVPADDATDIAITANVVITFNNKIFTDEVIVTSAAGAIVAATKSYDATGKILTINPDASLANSTVYLVAVTGVIDIYGQELAAVVKNFTIVAA